ncbi:MAG TPA: primosomal protein N', partial [Burkholderiaceae bacterium]|nr:primosomal protein N' [Burkholderiaceae bacterium]
ARDLGVPVVLGSATPSLESWANARAGRYVHLHLKHRARADAALPAIELVDTGQEPTHGGLSPRVEQALRQTLERGEQSLVFMNRRGYAPVLACAACGWVAMCSHCSAHVVFHKADGRMHCHHCGDVQRVPRACPTCGNQDLAPLGRGTQRIEETLTALLPTARLLRIDADAVRHKNAAETMFARVHGGDVDVLIGTQMVAKGHDFERMSVVVVLGADAALYSHDFRAPERLFQQLMQVAGRSGRAGKGGRVLVQTRYPKHPLFASLVVHDYARFAQTELLQREQARLPPYSYQAILRAESSTLAEALRFLHEARHHALALIGDGGVRVYDAVPMGLVRRADVERAQLLVESDTRSALQAFLPRWLAPFSTRTVGREFNGVRWHIEVDPLEI